MPTEAEWKERLKAAEERADEAEADAEDRIKEADARAEGAEADARAAERSAEEARSEGSAWAEEETERADDAEAQASDLIAALTGIPSHEVKMLLAHVDPERAIRERWLNPVIGWAEGPTA